MQYLINMDTIRAEKVPCPQFRVHSSLYANLSSLLSFNYAYRCKPGRYEVLSISFSRCFKQTQGGKGHVCLSSYLPLSEICCFLKLDHCPLTPPPHFSTPDTKRKRRKMENTADPCLQFKIENTEGETLPFFDFAYSF